ncbi:MAG: hypothetical protein ACKN83_09610 [Vulcanococcus sp.]
MPLNGLNQQIRLQSSSVQVVVLVAGVFRLLALVTTIQARINQRFWVNGAGHSLILKALSVTNQIQVGSGLRRLVLVIRRVQAPLVLLLALPVAAEVW